MADEVTLSGFRERFSAFSGRDDGEVQLALDEALLLHDVRVLATYYCAAHLLSLAGEEGALPDGGAGIIASEQIGPKRIEFLNMAGAGKNMNGRERDVFFATTPYGRRFLALERRTPRTSIGATVAR